MDSSQVVIFKSIFKEESNEKKCAREFSNREANNYHDVSFSKSNKKRVILNRAMTNYKPLWDTVSHYDPKYSL